MKERWKVLICSAALIIFFAIFPAQIFAAQNRGSAPKKTIRVGTTEISGFSEMDEEGNRVGILYDSIAEISKYSNWKIEYVDGGMQEVFDMLSSGDVDIVGCVSRDDSTEEMYDFPETPSGYIYTTIVSKADRKEYIPNDYDTFEGMRLGVYSNANKRKAELKTFCSNNSLEFELVYYDTLKEYEASMDNGETDGILTLNTSLKSDEKILARFSPAPYYFAVAKGRSDIVRELNQALEMVNTFDPELESKLYKKYFERDVGSVEFSEAELQYVKSNPEVKVVCLTNWRPFCYSEPQNGSFRGISIDVLEEIGTLSGIKFKYAGVDNFNAAVNMLSAGEADLFCGAFDMEYMKSKFRYVQAVSYLNAQTVMVTDRKSGTDTATIGGGKAALTYGFDNPYPFISADNLYFDSIDESVDAVRAGNADYALVSYLAMESYIRRKGEGNLAITPVSNANVDFTFAYRPDVSSLLVSVIDKSIYSLSDSDMHSFILKNTVKDFPVTFNSYLYANPYHVIGVLTVLCITVLLVVMLVMRMRMRYLKQTALIGEAYRLVGDIANEYLFEYNFESGELRLPDAFCQLTGSPTILKEENCTGGLEILYQYFASPGVQPFANVDFECPLANGKQESFRAVCTVLFNDKSIPIRGIGKILNYQEEAEKRRELEMRANTDGLTGFYTKSHFISLLESYLETVPDGVRMALVMIDLDYFKQVNDTIGHIGGDEVLKFLARYLRACEPESTICGRFGGDEFFLLMKDVKDSAALQDTLNEFCTYFNRDFVFGTKKCHISISIGAVCRYARGETVQELLHASDQALYQTKMNGRNGCVIFD